MNTQFLQVPVFFLPSQWFVDSFKISDKLYSPPPLSIFNLEELFNEDHNQEFCKFFVDGKCRLQKNCKSYHPRTATDAECSICKANVRASFRQFGILNNCNCVFCLPCIRQWRGRGNVGSEAQRTCPICQIKSGSLLPSNFLIVDQEDKVKILGIHKDGDICKYGINKCPLGENCSLDHDKQSDFCISLS